MNSPVPLRDGHDPEVVRENIRALSERMPYPNACGVALDRARRWWEWEHPGAELPPHLRRRADENLAVGSYELAVAEEEAPLARARSAEAAHRASRRMDLIDAPVEVVDASANAAAASIPASRGRISVTQVSGSAVIRPTSRLGNDFQSYVQAARPAAYDRAVNAQVAPLAALPGIVERLRAAGFEVDAAPEVLEAAAAAAAAPPTPESSSRGLVAVTPATTKSGARAAAFEPKQRLGDSFQRYRAAVAGSVWDGGNRNVAPIAMVAKIVKALSDDGFAVAVDPSLADAMKTMVEQKREDVAAGRERAEKLDAELRQKGMGLFFYQKEGVAWLSGRQNGMLLDDQGTGKTIQTLVSLPKDAPVLVVCPAVVKGVWRIEAKKWRPEFRVAVLATKSKEAFRWPEPGEIVVTNYDNLPDEGTYGPPPAGTVLVGDEAHWIKAGDKSARGRRFRALAVAVRERGGRTWGLSGTPLLNQPPELWNILSTFGLAEEAYGSKSAFTRMYGGEVVPASGRVPAHVEWTRDRSPEAGERLRLVSLRRRKEDVLPDLPAKVYQEIPVELSVKDRKALEKALKDAGIEVDEVVRAVDDAASGRSKLPAFTQLAHAREILAKAKIPSLVELVEEYEGMGEPVVVFSSHTTPVDALADRPGWAKITGEVPPEERTRIVEDFQAGRLRGVAATIKAAGTGITLTRAKTSVFVDQDWTPGNNLQATDRICRIGQTRGCNIKIMVADHAIDERVAQILADKRDLVDETVGASSVLHVEEAPEVEVDLDALADRYKAEIERERERDRVREEVARRRGIEMEERAEQARREAETRPPRSAAERFAASAMVTLAGLDPDRAAVKNDAGFDAASGEVGHSLAEEIRSTGELTEEGWALAKALARKFHRQVGAMPTEE